MTMTVLGVMVDDNGFPAYLILAMVAVSRALISPSPSFHPAAVMAPVTLSCVPSESTAYTR